MSCRSPAARERSASRAGPPRSVGAAVFLGQESDLGRRTRRAWLVACGLRAAALVRDWRRGWRRISLAVCGACSSPHSIKTPLHERLHPSQADGTLRQYALDNLPRHIGKAEVATLEWERQPLMIDA